MSTAEAAAVPDLLAALVVALKAIIASNADPYLLAGAPIEGIAATVAERIPPTCKARSQCRLCGYCGTGIGSAA